MKEPKKYYTRKEVADRFRISVQTVDAEVKRGNLKRYGIGRRVLFLSNDVDNALTEL
jgi:excisionase family DNA binding protein